MSTAAVGVPLAVWISSALYLWTHLNRGWYPWDEGTLAEPAARILRGELPHRDFVDAYTGALSYLHAGAFLLFGQELTSLRLVLFAFYVAWVPSLYYVASRFLTPFEAGAVTLTAIAWSVPNYPASMPSWYCLFFATFAIGALFRHLETGRRRWIFVAGLCAGASITMKIVGVYFVAASVVYFAFKASTDRREVPSRDESRRLSSAVAAIGIALSLGVLALVRTELGPSVIVNYAIPVVALTGFSFLSARAGEAYGTSSLRSFAKLATPFALGVAVPVGLLALPYIASGAIGDLVAGVWPSSRLTFAALRPPSVFALVALLPLVPVFYVPRSIRDAKPWERAAPVAVLAGLALVASQTRVAYLATWESLRVVVPVLTVSGLIVLHRRRNSFSDPRSLQQVFLLLASAAMCSLVQFPFSAPVYFIYVAPLVILAAVALIVVGNLLPRSVLWILIVFYLGFGVVRLNPSSLFDLGSRYHRETLQRLDLKRGGLEVPAWTANEYERLVTLVQKHSGTSTYIYATPDSPEVYFLSGFANPTKTLFEFLDAHPTGVRQLMQTLAQRRVNVVVINRKPAVSHPVSHALRSALTSRYPHQARAGQFEVRWRS